MSNNLIYQCRLGNFPDWAEHCVNSMRSYAIKVGANHMFSMKCTVPGLDQSIFLHRYFNILEPIYNPYFDQFDDILYVDTDVLADPDAENIFDLPKKTNTDVVGIYESPQGNSYPGHYGSDMREKFIKKYTRFDVPILRKRIEQINTGVIIFTKRGRLKARRTFDDWLPWVSDPEGSTSLNNDQPFLNAMFDKHRFNVLAIGDEWNMPPSWYNTIPCPKSHFYHFSGGSMDELITSFEGDNMPAGKKFS